MSQTSRSLWRHAAPCHDPTDPTSVSLARGPPDATRCTASPLPVARPHPHMAGQHRRRLPCYREQHLNTCETRHVAVQRLWLGAARYRGQQLTTRRRSPKSIVHEPSKLRRMRWHRHDPGSGRAGENPGNGTRADPPKKGVRADKIMHMGNPINNAQAPPLRPHGAGVLARYKPPRKTWPCFRTGISALVGMQN